MEVGYKMFLGQHHCQYDTKGLLTIPAHFREMLSSGAYLVQGFDRNFLVLTSNEFKAIYQRIVSMNIADPMARLLLRMLLGSATELEIDKDGRMVVPETLSDFIELKDEAVLVGMGNYFEVWSQGLWSLQALRLQDAEANSERFATLSITT